MAGSGWLCQSERVHSWPRGWTRRLCVFMAHSPGCRSGSEPRLRQPVQHCACAQALSHAAAHTQLPLSRMSSPHACFTQPALFCGLPQVPVPYALYFWRASKASKAAACERTCRGCLAWFAVPRRAPRDGPLARDGLDRHVMLLRSGLLRRASNSLPPRGTRTGRRQGGKNHRAPTQRAQQPPPWPLPGSTRDGPSACDALARFVVFLTCVRATP